MDIEEVRKHARSIAVGFGKFVADSGLVQSDPDATWRKFAKKGVNTVYDTKDGEWVTMEQLFDKYIKEGISGNQNQ